MAYLSCFTFVVNSLKGSFSCVTHKHAAPSRDTGLLLSRREKNSAILDFQLKTVIIGTIEDTSKLVHD